MTRVVRTLDSWPWTIKIVGAIGISVVLGLIFPPPYPRGTLRGFTHTFTDRPEHLHMPYTGQILMIIVTGGLSVAMLVYAVALARRHKSILPVLFWVGGLAAVALEPVVDVMANAIHSPDGAWIAFTVEDHPIPWHVVLCYPWYVGGLPIVLFDRMKRRVIVRRFWWDHYITVGMLVPIVEVVPAHYHIWAYYGVQPWRIGATPFGIAASNVCAVVVPALVIYMILPKLKTWRQQLIVIPLIAAVAMGAHAGSGVINYIVLGQDTQSIPNWLIQASAFAAVGMSIMLVWVMLEFVYGFKAVDDDETGAFTPPETRFEQAQPVAV